MKRLLALVVVLLCAHSTSAAQTSRIVKLKNSRHDFSTAGTAAIKAQSDDAICVFCHTPHNARPAVLLWNHKLTQGQTYNVYQSSTLSASIPQPQSSDSSKLCLSWHDSHGVPNGTSTNNGSLINFDLNIVAPNANAVGPIWTDLTPSPGSTTFSGSCSLRCHNVEHDSKSY